MSKHEIEVEGLPEGWEPVAYKDVHVGENILTCNGIIKAKPEHIGAPWLIVKKKQPRRITFEETDYNNVCDLEEGVKWRFCDGKYWREVKETEEPKLCLSVEECIQLSWDCRVTESVLYDKLIKFIKNNKTS